MKDVAFKKYNFKLSAENIRFYGMETEWPEGKITPENRNVEMIKALNYYNYVASDKDFRVFYEDWIRATRATTAKQDLALLKKITDRNIRPTFASLARMYVQGFPLTEKDHQRIWEAVVIAADKSSDTAVQEQPTDTVPKIGVQERMDAQVNTAVGVVEDHLEQLLNGKIKADQIKDPFGTANFSAIHYKKLAKALEPVIAEFIELDQVRGASKLKPSEEQLIEGYAFVKSRALKQTLDFLNNCMSTANRMASQVRVAKARKKKPIDKARLVRKFKYLAKHDELKLNSIQPVACLGASEVWVYDVRKRKLGFYKGEFDGSIMIKGSKFLHWSKTTSAQKTLRKPDKQIAEFLALNKNQMRKWFDKLKGVEHRMNGRGNEHLVLIRSS